MRGCQEEGFIFPIRPTGTEQSSVEGADGYVVAFGETVSRSFTVSFLDEDNALFKSNANGFESR